MNDEIDVPSISPMGESALGLHELFLSLTEGGFTESQALTLPGVMLAHVNRSRGEGED